MPFQGLGYVPWRIPFVFGTSDLSLTNSTGSDVVTTLSNNAIYRNITLNATGAGNTILRSAGWTIFCDILTLNNNKCIIQNNGSSAGASSPGVPGTAGVGAAGDAGTGSGNANPNSGATFFSGGTGGLGATSSTDAGSGFAYNLAAAGGGSPAFPGSSGMALGGLSGVGGVGAPAGSRSAAGAAAGGLDLWQSSCPDAALVRGGPNDPMVLLQGFAIDIHTSTPTYRKFAAGGGGGGGGWGLGSGVGVDVAGSGGGGGGGIYIFARRIVMGTSGIIEANGGNGGAASFTSGNSGVGCGGGGGGGGGAIILAYGEIINPGTIRANGGNGGAHVGGSGNSAVGGAGGQGGCIYHISDLGNQFVRGTNGTAGA